MFRVPVFPWIHLLQERDGMKSNVSHPEFGPRTTATEAASVFSEQIRGKIGE